MFSHLRFTINSKFVDVERTSCHILSSQNSTSINMGKPTFFLIANSDFFFLFNQKSTAMVFWVFGYGSLVWNPGFEYDEKVVGFIKDYRRVFDLGN